MTSTDIAVHADLVTAVVDARAGLKQGASR